MTHIHVTFMDGTWFIYDFRVGEEKQLAAAMKEFTSRLHVPGSGLQPPMAVKIFAVYNS